MILIFFALPDESRDLVRLLDNAERSGSKALPTWTGRIAGKAVKVAHTGVGLTSAGRVAEKVAASGAAVSMVICSGFAGALEPSLRIGDLVVGENYSDRHLADLVRGSLAADAHCIAGRLETVRDVAETVQEKRELFEKSGAVAVDMETAAVSEVFARAGTRFLSLRAISDEAAQGVPVPFPVWFDAERQQPRVAALLWHLATHPGKIAAFARFVSGVSLARKRLTQGLLRVVAQTPTSSGHAGSDPA